MDDCFAVVGGPSSEGALDADVDLPLKPYAPFPVPVLDAAALATCRAYVAAARSVAVAIDADAATDLEDQFVMARATEKISTKEAEIEARSPT